MSAPDPLVAFIADLEDEAAGARVRERIAAGEAPAAIIADCQAGLAVVGERYRQGSYFVAGLIMAGEIFREVMELLEPLVDAVGDPPALIPSPPSVPGEPPRLRVLIATVQGDIHDLGKNLVVMLLRSSHFEVHDLGVDVPAAEILRVARAERPDVIALSGLLQTSFPVMQAAVALLRDGLADLAPVPLLVVGGGQMTAETAAWIGADLWSNNAGRAVVEIAALAGRAAQE